MAKKAQRSIDPEIARLKYRVVNSHAKLALMVDDLSTQEVFALDTETDRLDALTAVLEIITISTDECNYVIPFKYIKGCLTRSEVIKELKPILFKKAVIFWNAKYDLHVLFSYGMTVPKYYDAMGMAHCYDPDDFNSLDHRAKKVLGYGKAAKFLEVKKRLIKTGNPREMFAYAARDSEATYQLGIYYKDRLKETDMWLVFKHQENKVIKEFFNMERRGIDVDVEYMKEVHENVTQQIEVLDERMVSISASYLRASKEFILENLLIRAETIMGNEIDAQSNLNKAVADEEKNPTEKTIDLRKEARKVLTRKKSANRLVQKEVAEKRRGLNDVSINSKSTRELGALLFEGFKLPVIKRSGETGEASTSKDVLNRLTGLTAANKKQREGIIFCRDLLKYRKLEKMRSTYTDMDSGKGMIAKLRKGKIHGSFNPFGAATGRASSSSPNMQNVVRNPKRDMDEKGNLLNRYPGNRVPGQVYLRDAFIAPEGQVFIGVDFSQIELRLIAHFSKDPVMLDVYHNGGDIHETTRAGCDLPLGEEGRVTAKAGNFGLHYGMGDESFAKQMNKSVAWANDFINKYWELYSRVKVWQESLISYCKGAGEIRCITHRRRLLPDINSHNFGLSKAQERVAINTIIQGSASDIIKNAMIKLGDNKVLKDNKCKMLLQVHDELIFKVPEENAEECCPIIQDIMETPIYPLNVPLVAKPATGKCWGEIH